MAVSPITKGMEKEIDRCYNAGLCGIGEIYPDGQGINIDNEKETRALKHACFERNIPLMIHTNEPVRHKYIGKNDIPLNKIERFIENNQELIIILAHWGGGLFFYESMKGIKEKFRNVFYDTAATPFLYDSRVYNVVKALGLCDKILFGSDFPLIPPLRYLDGINKSGLSIDEKELILGSNAKLLLRKKQELYHFS
jgi:predicted TIM-barrel fold metal-dependent hydrolase